MLFSKFLSIVKIAIILAKSLPALKIIMAMQPNFDTIFSWTLETIFNLKNIQRAVIEAVNGLSNRVRQFLFKY